MRMWRKAFEEQTGVSWDDRIKAHNERVRDRARDGDTPGLYSLRRGENGEIKSKTRAAEDAVPFEKRKFEYMPPLHAARGWLPEGKEEVPEAMNPNRGKQNEQMERTEQWTMSGGKGYGPDGPSLSPTQSIEDARPAQIDLTEDDPADEMDAPITPGGGNYEDATPTGFGATNVAAMGANGGPFGEMDTQAYDVDSLLAGTHDFFAQDNIFEAGHLAGQQQQDFSFDQDNIGFEAAQPAMGFLATMPAGKPFNYSASLPGQAQLAAKVGQDILNLGELDSAGEGGLVVIREVEQLAAAAGVEKRKRGDLETDEDMEPSSKRFLSQEFEDAETSAV
jgi:hypothetical protein